MFLLSGLAIIAKGFVKSDRNHHFASIMAVSGLFGTILTCLADVSNLGLENMSYMSLTLGVLAMICAFVVNFIEKCATQKYFWILAGFLFPIGLACYFLSHAPIDIWENLRGY